MLASQDHVGEAMAVEVDLEATWEGQHLVEYQIIRGAELLLQLAEVVHQPGDLALGEEVRVPWSGLCSVRTC